MPFTPLHLGPGAFLKGVAGDRVSFMVFGGSQVLMDLEPGYRIIVDDAVLHGPSHTIAGALLIGLVATLVGKPASEFALRLIDYPRATMTWLAASTSAFVGTFSHVFLDAIMHADMLPLAPWSDANRLLGMLSIDSLHIICLVLGAVGTVLFLTNRRRRNTPEPRGQHE